MKRISVKKVKEGMYVKVINKLFENKEIYIGKVIKSNSSIIGYGFNILYIYDKEEKHQPSIAEFIRGDLIFELSTNDIILMNL